MAYDWRPTASRNVTTGSSPVVVPPPAVTVAAAIEDFIAAAEEGRAVNRSGRHYRPSALRDVKGILRHHVAPALGERPLAEIRRADIQGVVERLGAERLSESRIRSVISALRALYAYSIDERYVEYNPADSLSMPSVGGDASPYDAPRYDAPAHDAPRYDAPAHDAPVHDASPDDAPRDDAPRDDGPQPAAADDEDYEPIAVLPERLLSLALRAALVVFAVVAIISLVQPA